jgi:hypothetical protein
MSGRPPGAAPMPLLRASRLSEAFPGTRALQDVDLEVHAGDVLFISRRIDEVLGLADRVVASRDGRVVADRPMEGMDKDMVIAGVAWYVLEYTPVGRHVYATGGNLEGASLAGVNTSAIVVGHLDRVRSCVRGRRRLSELVARNRGSHDRAVVPPARVRRGLPWLHPVSLGVDSTCGAW